jgi:hypothetical protein
LTTTPNGATNLLRMIARCPNVSACLADPSAASRCSTIVRSQSAALDDFQVPEPWSGDLAGAPILFLGSNPNISETEDYPQWRWPDDDIADFFQHRFGGGRKKWVTDGKTFLLKDGSQTKGWVRYWAAVRKRAIELGIADPRPGIDYALSEVVHCKSSREGGVPESADECARRYLEPLIAASGAKIVVSLGRWPEAIVRRQFGLGDRRVEGPLEFGHQSRLFAFLPHPNHRGKLIFADCVTREELLSLRAFLGR